MCDIELKENISDLMRDTFIDVLSGDINPVSYTHLTLPTT